MKINILLIGLFLNVIHVFAQSPQEMLKQRQEKLQAQLKEYNEGNIDTNLRYFYKTYNDFVAGKPVQGTKFTGKRKIVVGIESVLISANEDFDYKKVKELNYWGFIDEWGQLERIFDNHCYYVLDTGKICSYVKAIDAEMTTDKNGNVSLNWLSDNSAGYKDYISKGLTAPVIDFDEKKFESLTIDHPEIFQQFSDEQIDNRTKDSRSKKTFKIQKYVLMYDKLP